MKNRTELQILLLLLGFFLLYYATRFPTWFFYVVMLAVLGGTHLLAPDWLRTAWIRLFWWAGVGVAGGGLVLELVSGALK